MIAGKFLSFRQRAAQTSYSVRRFDSKDLDDLEIAFKDFDMQIQETEYINLKKAIDAYKTFASEQCSESINVVVFLFSGSAATISQAIFANDGVLRLNEDIIKPLIDSKASKGQLCWIIIDVHCRYQVTDEKVNNSTLMQQNIIPTSKCNFQNLLSNVTPHENLLISYSETKANTSSSPLNVGSMYIRELCKVVEENGKNLDVLNILRRVTNKVVEHKLQMEEKKMEITFVQIPTFISYLTRPVYFTRDMKSQQQVQRIIYQEQHGRAQHGRALILGQNCHWKMITDVNQIFCGLNFNTDFVRYGRVVDIETDLRDKLLDRINSEYDLLALVVFIQDHEDDQHLGHVIRQTLVENGANWLAGMAKIIIIIRIENETVEKAAPLKIIGQAREIATNQMHACDYANFIIYYCRGFDNYNILLGELESCKDTPEECLTFFTRVNASAVENAAKVDTTTSQLNFIESTMTKELLLRSTPKIHSTYLKSDKTGDVNLFFK